MDWLDLPTLGTIYFAGEWLIRIVMLFVVPWRRTPAAAKGWLLLLFFLPYPGVVLYWLIGRPTLPRRRLEQLARLFVALEPVTARLQQDRNIFHPELGPELSQAVILAKNLGHLPILGGNAVDVLVDYEGTIDRLVQDIDAAQHHVHLLFYIFANDQTTAKVIQALGRAVKRGVAVRVLVDALGSRALLPALLPALTEAGAEVHEMLPVGLLRWRAARIDLRNHRKIAVIDGRIGYSGSQNLVSPVFKEGITYEELVLRVTGPIVLELQYVFVADWYLETEVLLDSAEVFPSPITTGSVPCQALPSGPGFPVQNVQTLFVALVHGARKRVVITTPYFIPDEPLLQALQTAVLRGVEVHLVVSEKEDQFLVGLAQKSYYEELLGAGVTIHLYRHRFLHAKHITVDESIAVVGSSNMDIRSFVLNAELVVLCYDAQVVGRMGLEQEHYRRHCRVLTLAEWQQRSRASSFLQNLARLMSPLL